MDSILKSLVGQKVTVFTGSGAQDYRDTGMLDTYDDQFLRLRDDKAKYLYIAIGHIRIIKPA